MIRRELIGMAAAFAVACFSGIRAGTDGQSPAAKTAIACQCCGASCSCPTCFCDVEKANQESCPCCGGATCCSAGSGHAA
jgi:hypothetical protein